MNLEFVATAAFGLESIVARELKQLGYNDIIVENGRVSFGANAEALARCNLWLRSADRLFLKIGQFEARSFEELFDKTRELPWPDWLPKNASFPVEGKSIKSRLYSVSDCQAIVKKAIVEKMKDKYHLTWFPETGPRYRIEVSLLEDIATLSIDTSGLGLHKRGYRKLAVEAPLKETLAAALVSISRWKPDRVLVDPFCGSGTIPIEAALIGLNIAPGLHRQFDAEFWPTLNPDIWEKAREEARDLIKWEQPLGIVGYDINNVALEKARYHAKRVGLEQKLSFRQQEVKDLKSRYRYGYLVCNPPYGERLSADINTLYREMFNVFEKLSTWSYYILTSHPNLEKLLRRKADKRRKLYNGRIQCTYYQFYGPRPKKLQGPFVKNGC